MNERSVTEMSVTNMNALCTKKHKRFRCEYSTS